MKILFLGNADSPLISFLRKTGDDVVAMSERIVGSLADDIKPDFVVSYGYRYIIGRDIVSMYRDKIINLHISYLPWNRGADPNFWSFIDKTPKGVTIHYIDEGIDTGDIIAQKEVFFGKHETLKTSYETLQEEIQRLFYSCWAGIREGKCISKKQEGEGTFHKMKDKESLVHMLARGWDTPVSLLESYKHDASQNNRT